MTTQTQPGDPASFEALFEQLERHAQQLESADLPLQSALDEYEQAVNVAGQLKDMLRTAELRIDQLSQVLQEERTELEDAEADFEDYLGDEDDQ